MASNHQIEDVGTERILNIMLARIKKNIVRYFGWPVNSSVNGLLNA